MRGKAKIYEFFKKLFEPQDLEEEMHRLMRMEGKVKVTYARGQLDITVAGQLKGVTINGQKIEVKPK